MFMRPRAIGRHLSRAREWFPVTNLGLLVAGIGALAYWGFGLPRADYVVRLVSLFAMFIVAVAVLAVLLGTWLVLRATRPGMPISVAFEAHRGYAEVFSLPSWWALPIFDVTWSWLEPPGFRVETVRLGGRRWERVETERRGHTDRIVRRITIEDGFGLARLVLHRAEARSVTVVPWTGALDRAPLLRSYASGDSLPHPAGELVGDKVDMRRYVPGDPLKLAMWKVYARTRQLMVRTPERALEPSTQVAAYLVSAEADEPAAAAARVAVETGLLGPDWIFAADGPLPPANDPQRAIQAIVESRAHRDQPTGQAGGLSRFVQEHAPSDATKLVVFVPGRPGPWLDRVVEAARGRPERTSCVVVVDGVKAPPTDKMTWSRWLQRPEPSKDEEEAWVTSEELNEVIESLARARVDVSALDRIRGRALNARSRTGYGQLTTRLVA